jgi:hypothetical protein
MSVHLSHDGQADASRLFGFEHESWIRRSTKMSGRLTYKFGMDGVDVHGRLMIPALHDAFIFLSSA